MISTEWLQQLTIRVKNQLGLNMRPWEQGLPCAGTEAERLLELIADAGQRLADGKSAGDLTAQIQTALAKSIEAATIEAKVGSFELSEKAQAVLDALNNTGDVENFERLLELA